MRVVFAGGGTGGHLYPALAIARAMVRLEPTVEPYFVGARRGIERDVLPKSGFPFALLDLHPLYRSRPWLNGRTIGGLARAWRALGGIARERTPAAIVGTGGYASGAALAYAMVHRFPIALQEQNSYPGLTTRLASRVAREIYLGYEDAARHLHPRQGAWVGETGNPIEPPPSPRPNRAAARLHWGFPPDGGRVLLAFGGSQGARPLNEALAAWIARGVPNDLYVIWATGAGGYHAFKHLASERVRVEPYLAPIADAYAASDLALTRAGALTSAELNAWGIPAILVPLPTAAADHQSANARALSSAGAAVMLAQRDLSAGTLEGTIGGLLNEPARLAAIASRAADRGRPFAAETIARRVLALARGGAAQA
ncbi:MAG: UDP-N-acetylglucosamine--N-acetylmuramyl-(pentapeptide) pyrophosphoryl-undecaprenol N-acetylglucosamine transferase [Gemmatimonadaceae bacterium]